jgi:K+-transporting ATPase ATPase C chain
MKSILQSLRVILVFTVLTGVLYPLVVTAFAKVVFKRKASGSLIVAEGKVRGSELLAQKTASPRYFWARPSAAEFATGPGGASNKGPTSADLAKAIAERRAHFGAEAPVELLTASGSGLDPHLSPAAAKDQAARIAAERKLTVEQVIALISQHTEPPQWGFLGEPRVNVFALNRALDATP